MTVASIQPALPVSDLDMALALLRTRGLRVSASRRLVLEALFASDAPLTAEAIAAGRDDRGPLDVASVYRNLETLERVGLVRHVHLGHAAGLYAVARGEEREYLLCEGCGAVRTLLPAELDGVRTAVSELDGFRARFTHFPIVGECADCAAGRRAHP